MSTPTLALFFVADGKRLEGQSWMLASTLAHAHRGDTRIKLFAYVSADHRPLMSDTTLAIYQSCGVELRVLPPPPEWKRDYPHGNKIIAACDDRGTSHSIFLDTDMVCTRSLADFLHLPPQGLAAAPEGRRTWGGLDRWDRAYAHFGLPMPPLSIRLLRHPKAKYVPYFNAGFIAFSEAKHPQDGKRFADHWLETALDFDHNCSIANKRPWLDQITLPLTAARFAYTMQVLGETYNYSLSHRSEAEETPDAIILHYHRRFFLKQAPQWPMIKDRVREFVPAEHHPELELYLEDIDQATLD